MEIHIFMVKNGAINFIYDFINQTITFADKQGMWRSQIIGF